MDRSLWCSLFLLLLSVYFLRSVQQQADLNFFLRPCEPNGTYSNSLTSAGSSSAVRRSAVAEHSEPSSSSSSSSRGGVYWTQGRTFTHRLARFRADTGTAAFPCPRLCFESHVMMINVFGEHKRGAGAAGALRRRMVAPACAQLVFGPRLKQMLKSLFGCWIWIWHLRETNP